MVAEVEFHYPDVPSVPGSRDSDFGDNEESVPDFPCAQPANDLSLATIELSLLSKIDSLLDAFHSNA